MMMSYLPVLVQDVIPLVHMKSHPPVSVDCLTYQLKVTMSIIICPVSKYCDIEIAKILRSEGVCERGRD